MIEDYDGQHVLDTAGEQLGTVERSFVDDTGSVKVVEVKMGRLRVKHRLIPTDEVESTDGGLQVPYSREVVEESPDVSDLGETLDGETFDAVRAYYAGSGEGDAADAAPTGVAATPVAASEDEAAPASGAESGGGLGERVRGVVDRAREAVTGSSDAGSGDGARDAGNLGVGAVRDLGDVIEVPIVEERLVKQPVVKEVLRVRKSTVGQQQNVSEELRKEDVEIEQDPGVEVHERP
jgi:hypothetical protein